MISKKSRKVVAALLIGATVCASGTFAYFNSKVDLNNISGVTNTSKKTLDINNGTVVIEGKLAGSSASNLKSYWTYDVAKISTINSVNTADEENARKAIGDRLGIKSVTSYASDIASSALDDDITFIDANRSPDLKEVQTDGANPVELARTAAGTDGLTRTKVGAEVAGAIKYARPGDAFVVGGSSSDGKKLDDQGIEIVNKSTLTTKIGIGLNSEADATKIQKQIESMAAAGWKIYVRVVNGTTNAQNGNPDLSDWTELDSSVLTTGGKLSVATLAPATDAANGDSTGVKIQIRVELPLETVNTYQNKTIGKGVLNPETKLDITNLFEIVATQENNPGWNQNGSDTRPTSADVSKPGGGN